VTIANTTRQTARHTRNSAFISSNCLAGSGGRAGVVGALCSAASSRAMTLVMVVWPSGPASGNIALMTFTTATEPESTASCERSSLPTFCRSASVLIRSIDDFCSVSTSILRCTHATQG
jgi:hypothetical protein